MRRVGKKLVQSFLEESKFTDYAYLNDVDGRLKFEEDKKKHLMFFSGRTTQVFVVIENEKDFIISFRGTEVSQIEDMLADVNFKLIDYLFGRVHEGFYLALDEVFLMLVSTIEKHWSEGSKIKVNGHSLGGALAILFGTRLVKEEGFKDIVVTTFGQPRVGDEEFINHVEKMFGENYRRVVNNLDLVPKLPPVTKLEYAHSDTLYLIDESGDVFKADASAQYFQLFKEMIIDFADRASKNDEYKLVDEVKADLKESVYDHAVTNYIKQLVKAEKRYESTSRPAEL